MNEQWDLGENSTPSWQETPYVSQYKPDEQKHLLSQVATKAFAMVFIGLIITTIVSYFTLSDMDFMLKIYSNGTLTFLLIAEIVVVLVNGWAIRKDNLILAGVLYFVYSISNGITLSIVFLAYDLGTIKEAFLMAAIIFGVMAAFGYFTKKDLSTVGSVCTMALIGVVLVSLLNAFLFKSSGLDLVMDYVVVLLFVGITAYDMYKMKQLTLAGGEGEVNRVALFTGMQLYLDFINIFLRLIRIMGRKR